MGYILGLDLGITSVGFGIIEEGTYKIIKYGVRLFDESDKSNNLIRRTMRGSRRLNSRKENRKSEIKRLLRNNNICNKVDSLDKSIYDVRIKGLSEKLTNNELANVLVNFAKRRGSSLEVATDSDSDEGKLKSALKANSDELKKKDMYICQLIKERLNNGEKIRTTKNVFKTSDYEKELKKILENQDLDEEINNEIVKIIFRRRLYSVGPGSERFPTKYGSYRVKYKDGKKYIEHVNLIEEMRGKCSIFENKPRIAKNTYKACLFNLLNDLNNINYGNNNKITEEEKLEIIENIKTKWSITPTQLVKYINTKCNTKYKIGDFEGFRVDKNKNPLLTEFAVYKKIFKIIGDKINSIGYDKIDEIVELLTRTQILSERREQIKEFNYGLSDDEVEGLSNLTKVNGYHSLSKKAMDILNPELIKTNYNQMQLIYSMGLKKNKDANSNKIEFDESAILSPVVKRVHRQAIDVVNELRKEYGEFSSIVIETTRDKNSEEQRKNIQEYQKRQEANKKRTNDLLLEMQKDPSKYNAKTKLKLVLYNQQEGKTIYSGKDIDLDTLLEDDSAYQIEHIIPYAVSFDNSFNNKALASYTENQDKARMSPWGYFSSGKVEGPNDTWEKYVAFVNSLKMSKKKKSNLLNQDDISKFDSMGKFVSRNLNDTSYAIRSIMGSMKSFFKSKGIETNIFTLRGNLTHTFRVRVGLKKDRDIYIHHAIDALIIAGSKNQKIFNNAFKLETKDGITSIKETGEVIDFDDDPLKDSTFLQFVKELKNIEGKPQDFSYKVDKKTNRQFSDATIYSTRKIDNVDYVVAKFKDIYGKQDAKSLDKMFEKGTAKDKLLCAKNDSETFKLLEQVYNEYKDAAKENNKGTFQLYFEENKTPIRKYSKKGNGPAIKQIKYLNGKLGSCIDISNKYNVKNKKVVLQQVTSYRADVYKSKEGLYKFLTIRRYEVKQINGKNVIDKDLYNKKKLKKKITDDYKFIFSLNRNDLIDFVKDSDLNGESKDNVSKYYRYINVNDDGKNKIEIKYINKKTDKQIMVTVGKRIIKFEKINASVTGKWKKSSGEVLKLEW